MDTFIHSTFIRGFHAYTGWEPFINEELPCEREEGNERDEYAVSIIYDGNIVGHVALENSKIVNLFIKKGGVVKIRVTGGPLNRGRGLGVEVQYMTF